MDDKGNTRKYFPHKDKFIGSVLQVDASSIKGESSFITENFCLTFKVGDYIVVNCETHGSIGQITHIKEDFFSANNKDDPQTVCAIEADIFASLNYDTGVISAGLMGAPKLYSDIFLADPNLIQRITTRNYQAPDSKTTVLLEIGHLANAEQTPLAFTPNSLFGRHLAVVGTTGAGKSWTLSRIFEEVAKFNSKLIIFDASGEFNNLPEGTAHVSVGVDPVLRPNVHAVSVPYTDLLETDLYAIFKPTGRSQFPKLKQAIKSLKLAQLAPHLALNGVIMKAHRSKLDYEEEYKNYVGELESPVANFNINYLTTQIENECVNPQRSPTETDTWGGLNGDDYSDCVPLINRINDIIRSPNLAPIFNPGKRPSLLTVIKRFITDDTIRILRISLQYLSFDHNAREIIANALGRHLLEIARSNFFIEQPLLVAVDEAHQFLNDAVSSTGDHFPLNSFSLIAKEGRKYGINICLATQRPRDIPEGVFSQMGTVIAHRLINPNDRKLIEAASSFMDSNTAESLPALAPGDAILLGVDFPIPLRLSINQSNYPPDSRGPDYQKYWKVNDQTELSEYESSEPNEEQ